MRLGSNIQYLRRQKQMTQEQLAERMDVSRQTVSRWETNAVTPELDKLVAMCELFACRLDSLVREDLTDRADVYSPVEIRRIPGFRMARYVMITPNPEDDVNAYMDAWARRAKLPPASRRICWDFPFVTAEQQNRFGLRGYAASYVLPEGFAEVLPGVEYAAQETADYAVITVRDPFAAAFERIPGAYHRLMAHLGAGGFREKVKENVLGCFEYVYEKDGVTFMDVFVQAESVLKTDAFTDFSVG